MKVFKFIFAKNNNS